MPTRVAWIYFLSEPPGKVKNIFPPIFRFLLTLTTKDSIFSHGSNTNTYTHTLRQVSMNVRAHTHTQLHMLTHTHTHTQIRVHVLRIFVESNLFSFESQLLAPMGFFVALLKKLCSKDKKTPREQTFRCFSNTWARTSCSFKIRPFPASFWILLFLFTWYIAWLQLINFKLVN